MIPDPYLRIIEQVPDGDRDLIMRDSEIALAGPECACPPPDVAQHSAVQVQDEFLRQKVASPAERPVLPARNVVLFHLVEFAAIGNVRRNEPTPVLRCERRGVLGLLE